jgi:hypothetical protein
VTLLINKKIQKFHGLGLKIAFADIAKKNLPLSATAVKNLKRYRRQRLKKIVFKTEQKPLLNREQIKNS